MFPPLGFQFPTPRISAAKPRNRIIEPVAPPASPPACPIHTPPRLGRSAAGPRGAGDGYRNLTARGLANLAWASAKLAVGPPGALAALADAAVHHDKMRTMNAQVPERGGAEDGDHGGGGGIGLTPPAGGTVATWEVTVRPCHERAAGIDRRHTFLP